VPGRRRPCAGRDRWRRSRAGCAGSGSRRRRRGYRSPERPARPRRSWPSDRRSCRARACPVFLACGVAAGWSSRRGRRSGAVGAEISRSRSRMRGLRNPARSAHTQTLGLGVGRFAGSFEAVDDQPVRLGLQMSRCQWKEAISTRPPVAASSLHHLPADKVLKTGRTGPK
jgi:hypothetical protein